MNMLSHFNYAAVLAGALAYFGLGSLWYSKYMFLGAWMDATKMPMDSKDKSHARSMLIYTFVCSVVIGFAMEILVVLCGSTSFTSGALLGVVTAIGFGSTAAFINSMFEDRPVALVLINGGYHLAGCIIVGMIESIWRSV